MRTNGRVPSRDYVRSQKEILSIGDIYFSFRSLLKQHTMKTRILTYVLFHFLIPMMMTYPTNYFVTVLKRPFDGGCDDGGVVVKQIYYCWYFWDYNFRYNRFGSLILSIVSHVCLFVVLALLIFWLYNKCKQSLINWVRKKYT